MNAHIGEAGTRELWQILLKNVRKRVQFPYTKGDAFKIILSNQQLKLKRQFNRGKTFTFEVLKPVNFGHFCSIKIVAG